MSYNRFAEVYDQLMSHAPYDKWVALTKEIIDQSEEPIKRIVDLGCGTGKITIPLAEAGYQMTGVDLSDDMLTLATGQSQIKNLKVNWIHQDITELTGFRDVDLFISYCDVINYVTSKDDVYSVFQRVFDSLKEAGQFIFDVHSMDYVNNYLVDQTFADVEDGLAYIWDCEPGDVEGEMFHHLTFFAKVTDQYERFDEMHHQQVYSLKVYKQLLKKAGFTKIQIFNDFDQEIQLSEKSHERIFIVAKK